MKHCGHAKSLEPGCHISANRATALINGERLTVLGWGRAILMQVAHPLVAAGVGGHSPFRSSPVAAVMRLRHTINAMLALSFGSDAEADRTVRAILAIHDRVHGQLSDDVGAYPAGTAYSAHDPELLLWVHATLLDSVLMTYETLVEPLNPGDRDAFVSASAGVTTRLGLPIEQTPRTASALENYLAEVMAGGRLAVSPAARELAEAVLTPPGWRLIPFARVTRLLTIGTLPAAIRALYGYDWLAGHQRRLLILQATIRRARALSPDVLARWGAARGHNAQGDRRV